MLNRGINVCVFAPANPPSASVRGVGQSRPSSSMTASLAPWLSNADLISGPGMWAGLNSQLLTRTQMGFGFIKANILSVIRRHFSCTDVGLPVRSNGPLHGYEWTICQALFFCLLLSPLWAHVERNMQRGKQISDSWKCFGSRQSIWNNNLKLYGRLFHTSKNPKKTKQ